MHDLVIRNARLVDGTGTPSRAADVAIDAGKFVEIGANVATAHRELNADGLLLSPGWVDIHTHYDGQALRDPQMTPSSWHGVTTAVFGSCDGASPASGPTTRTPAGSPACSRAPADFQSRSK